MFVCQNLVQGFCTIWIEVEPLSSIGTPITASSSSLGSVEIIQAFSLGFFLSGSVFLVAYAARIVRRALSEL